MTRLMMGVVLVVALLGACFPAGCGKQSAAPIDMLVTTTTELNVILEGIHSAADAKAAAPKIEALAPRWTAALNATKNTIGDDPSKLREFDAEFNKKMKEPLQRMDRNVRQIRALPGLKPEFERALDTFTSGKPTAPADRKP